MYSNFLIYFKVVLLGKQRIAEFQIRKLDFIEWLDSTILVFEYLSICWNSQFQSLKIGSQICN